MNTPAEPHYDAHGVTVHHGHCRKILPGLTDASVDAVTTDPPYELGFMGRAWDASGIAYDVAMWAECLRVLKPGGHLLAFGGTRTWHRLACAIEDAGFEIRDTITWLYGCHDDRTEVLTRRGWVNGLDLTPADDVAQWDTDGTVTLVRPSALRRYPFDGRLVRFRNADVDQLVTPNHRVVRQVRERQQTAGVRAASWSPWRVDAAADVNRWQPMRLPAAGVHDGPGIGGTDYAALLGWVWAEGGFDLTGTGVRVYQSSTNQPFVDEIAALMDRLGPHKRYDQERQWRGRDYTAVTWFMSGDLARRVRADLPGKAPTWDLLWRMTADEKRALWDAAMKGDGSKAQRALWQQDRAALEWAQALLAAIGCRGKVADDPRGVLYWTDRPTVELQRRHLADDGEDYTGEVWCVTVPSGAFVVRRNGRVSVSGNSGFPKSLDVSKAIDKAAGAEREVVGHKGGRYAYVFTDTTGAPMGNISPRENGPANKAASGNVTAPATDDAARWQGWGTALKPASEPIVVARKPLNGTVAATVLRHGTGALNIDATRVPGALGGDPDRFAKTDGGTFVAFGDRPPMVRSEGRWPSNVVLSHAPDCQPVGTRKVRSNAPATWRTGQERTEGWGNIGETRPGETRGGYAAADGTETVEAWDCADGCPVAELDAQSGMLKSGALDRSRITAPNKTYGTRPADLSGTYEPNEGGASRFFPTFRYEAKADAVERPRAGAVAHPTVKPLDLMRWLVRLVTPPTVSYLHCVSCGYDTDPMRRVRADVPAQAQGTGPLLPDVPPEARRAGEEEPTGAVPDLREGVDRADADLLLGSVSGGLAEAVAASLPAVQCGVPTDTNGSEVLHEDLRRSGDEARAEDVRVVPDRVPADRVGCTLLLEDMRSQGVGDGETQGTPADGEGVRAPLRTGAPDGDADRLPAGAPQGDGRAPRTDTDARRGGASPQRGQGRQPDGEPAGASQAGSRPDPQASAATDHLPALPRSDRGVGSCPSCDGDLRRVDQPGVVLDPFAGSGTTAEACLIEGFRCITIEREADYLPLIVHRITKRMDPVANLTAQADRGEDVDLGLFGLLDDLGGVA